MYIIDRCVCVCLRYFNAYIGTMHVFNCMVLGLVKEAMECHGWLAEGQRVSLNAAIIWVSLASVGSNWWSRMCQTWTSQRIPKLVMVAVANHINIVYPGCRQGFPIAMTHPWTSFFSAKFSAGGDSLTEPRGTEPCCALALFDSPGIEGGGQSRANWSG